MGDPGGSHARPALSPNLQVGQNRLRAVFLDPAEKALYPDWDQATAGLVAGFRQSVGSDVDDPGFVQLVGELSLASERFRLLWARHDVGAFEGAPVRLDHPQVGELALRREKLAITGTEGQLLVIYHAQPGTSSAEKLTLLASLANSGATPDCRKYGSPGPAMNAVLVIGATGKTGSALVDLLRARAEPVRAASRTPNAADAIRFDWDEITTHGSALDGVDRVYLVPPPSAVDPVPVVEPFLAEARRRGIRPLVMLGSAIEFPH